MLIQKERHQKERLCFHRGTGNEGIMYVYWGRGGGGLQKDQTLISELLFEQKDQTLISELLFNPPC